MKSRWLPLVILYCVVLVLALAVFLVWKAEATVIDPCEEERAVAQVSPQGEWALQECMSTLAPEPHLALVPTQVAAPGLRLQSRASLQELQKCTRSALRPSGNRSMRSQPSTVAPYNPVGSVGVKKTGSGYVSTEWQASYGDYDYRSGDRSVELRMPY